MKMLTHVKSRASINGQQRNTKFVYEAANSSVDENKSKMVWYGVG